MFKKFALIEVWILIFKVRLALAKYSNLNIEKHSYILIFTIQIFQ